MILALNGRHSEDENIDVASASIRVNWRRMENSGEKRGNVACRETATITARRNEDDTRLLLRPVRSMSIRSSLSLTPPRPPLGLTCRVYFWSSEMQRTSTGVATHVHSREEEGRSIIRA